MKWIAVRIIVTIAIVTVTCILLYLAWRPKPLGITIKDCTFTDIDPNGVIKVEGGDPLVISGNIFHNVKNEEEAVNPQP